MNEAEVIVYAFGLPLLMIGIGYLIGAIIEIVERRRSRNRIWIEPFNEYTAQDSKFFYGFHYYFNNISYGYRKLSWKMRLWCAYIRFMDWLAEKLHRLLGSPESWELWS